MTLYKFMERQYAGSLLASGSIRIGTIFDFRDSRYEDGIRDEDEGKRHLYTYVAEKKVTSDSDPWLEKHRFIGVGNMASVTLVNCAFSTAVECPDHHVLCLSLSPTANVDVNSLSYEACLEICYPRSFFRAISREMKLQFGATYVGRFDVRYGNRVSTQAVDDGQFAGLLKDPKYSYQREHRALWRAREGTAIKPEILQVANLGRYCRLVN